MSFPDRNNPYDFEAFLEWRNGVDYYADDPFIQRVVTTYCGDEAAAVDGAARKVSHKASHRWRDASDRIGEERKRPWIEHFDGHNNRVDRIVRPHETEVMEREVFGEALFSDRTSAWEKLTKMYLIYQNGEACISCPVTCTEGLVKLLEQFAEGSESLAILNHLKEGVDGEFAIGAQYLSEIQGGSDVPANLAEAEQDGDGNWRIYGTKFFCSATHADYAVVTAKPRGSEDIANFVVPSWLPGDKEKQRRNGFTIDRIKRKMGTSEMPTCELTFNGALAYPVGPFDRGLANVVAIVLTYSRLTVGLSSAATMTRAAREARGYAEFRTAFGQKLAEFPMVTNQLQAMDLAAQRSTAGAFKLYQQFLQMEGTLNQKLESGDLRERQRRFETRELIMLQKAQAAYDATDVLREAISIYGGHGAMEDFSALPRLFRDSAINELWEGPRNVLLTQVHRDCQRVASWYPPAEFVANLLAGLDPERSSRIATEFAHLIAHPSLLTMDDATLDACVRWDQVCTDLVHAYQDVAILEVRG
jgi:alkylation response protein AidB-like acyl-CoA dehydrogenase